MPAAAHLGPRRQSCAGWWAWLVTAALCGPAVLCRAVQAVKTFIRSPDIFQCDFWELPAVQQLAQDKSSAPLLQLLDVVLQGDLQGEQQGPSCAVLGRLVPHNLNGRQYILLHERSVWQMRVRGVLGFQVPLGVMIIHFASYFAEASCS